MVNFGYVNIKLEVVFYIIDVVQYDQVHVRTIL